MTDIALPIPTRIRWPKLGMFLGGLVGLALAVIYSNSFNLEVTETNDSEHGPTQISGGLCPDIPTGAADYTVSNESAALSALSALNGIGGIIEISDGNYDWGSFTITAAGADENNRIYIRSETLYGASFAAGNRWNIDGDFVTVSGFNRTVTNNIGVRIKAHNARVACHEFEGPSATQHGVYTEVSNTEQWDYLEVDNNYFNNWLASGGLGANAIKAQKCSSAVPACVRAPQQHHYHHNYFEANPSSTSAIYIGESRLAQEDPNDPWNSPKERTNFLIENNTFNWRGYQTMNVKTSSNIYRFNCFETGTRVPSVRKGHDHLWYGNWFRTPPDSVEGFDSGWGIHKVYNYLNSDTEQFSIRSGQYFIPNPDNWAYISSSEGVYKNNVCDGCAEFVEQMWRPDLSTLDIITNPLHKPLAVNNVFQNNLIRRSAGTPQDYDGPSDGHTNESTFKANNTFSNNTSNSNQKTNAPCFTPGHADGSTATVTGSDRLSTFGGTIDYGSGVTIQPPSWW